MSPQNAVPAKATSSQPQAATEMNIMNATATAPTGQQAHCEHQQKASRIRGGGAGKDCFMTLFGCFLCFECCEGCCDCVADIVCCPCELCC
ncbi:hypothetical protein BDQ12DRAFT_689100 [Crucibulum laeve]|uniref:Cysteine-rich transmembrane CYSTM domain-containing protein n=1 Tax=Crucibulum laeve TaxID=68775 RepID=A0A5C3LR12_9AGAR|nr:hypothetical protein BDQ12DRAFT_689100 [Crucibulum laeve]